MCREQELYLLFNSVYRSGARAWGSNDISENHIIPSTHTHSVVTLNAILIFHSQTHFTPQQKYKCSFSFFWNILCHLASLVATCMFVLERLLHPVIHMNFTEFYIRWAWKKEFWVLWKWVNGCVWDTYGAWNKHIQADNAPSSAYRSEGNKWISVFFLFCSFVSKRGQNFSSEILSSRISRYFLNN